MLDLESVKSQIVSQFNPAHIVLFGSQAKGTASENSDIDLCVVVPTNDKRHFLTDLYCMIECDTPIDFVLYTPEEWNVCISDQQSFAYKINHEGVRIYG